MYVCVEDFPPLGTEDRKALTWNIINLFMVLKEKKERLNEKKRTRNRNRKRKQRGV